MKGTGTGTKRSSTTQTPALTGGGPRFSGSGGIVGVSDHGGWAVFVTVTPDGTLLDRRRIEIVDDDLPALPHHHEGQLLPPAEAVELVERVRVSAERHSVRALDELAAAAGPVLGIALRALPSLPATIAERISDSRARNVADWVMYRTAIASAAAARGWPVYWYDSKSVFGAAGRALNVKDFDVYFTGMRRAVGPPWNADHKLAMAAALVAAESLAAPARQSR